MQWSEIKGDCWTIPASRAKNGKAHVVHLTVQAQKVLAQIPRQAGSDLVFTTTGKTAISGFSNAREALAKASGVQDWRFHDVRRTVTTGLANLGHPPHVCDKILNHVSGTISGVKAVYQKAEFLSERRQALEDWAAHIDFICQSKVPAAVLTE
jgi:integrase